MNVSLPSNMQQLEQRAWTLAGERMLNEPLRALAQFADRTALALITDSVEDLSDPVASFFNAPVNERLSEVLSRYEWRSLTLTVIGWAQSAATAPPIFVPAIDGLTVAPPKDRPGFDRWMLDHELHEALLRPLSVLATLAPSHRARHDALFMKESVVDDALTEKLDRRSRDELRVAARSYLAWCAGRRKREEYLAALRATPSSVLALAEAVERIERLIEALRVEHNTEATAIPLEDASFGFDEDALSVSLTTSSGPVWLSLVERSGERARSSLDSPDFRFHRLPLLHRLAEHALEVLLDEAAEDHETVVRSVTAPRWSRLLTELEREVRIEEPVEDPFPEGQRLVYRVGFEAGTLVVEPAVQKPRRGGFTKGQRLDWHMLTKRGVPLEARDARVVDAWFGVGSWAAHARGEGTLLEALVGHPRVVMRDDPTIPVRVKHGVLSVAVHETRGDSHLRFELDGVVLEANQLITRIVGEHVVDLRGSEALLSVARIPPAVHQMALACARWETGLPKEADDVLLRLLARLPSSVGVRLPPRLRGETREPDLTPVVRLEPLPGGGLRAEIWMRPLSSGPVQRPGEGPIYLVGVEDGKRFNTVRDHAAERAAAERFASRLGMENGAPDGPNAYVLDEPEHALDLLSALQSQADGTLRVEWPKDARPWRVMGRVGWGNTKVRVERAGNWFALRGDAKLDEGKVTLAEIMGALAEGRRYVKLGRGRFAAISDELRAALGAVSDVVFRDGKELGVASGAIAQLEAHIETLEADADWVGLRARLLASSSIEVEVPKGLNATLRAYQEEGIRWLLRLSSWAEGACLADDMGLGKTLQALALLIARAEDGPALVVCPTSLVDNWRRECERFAPSLRARAYRGSDRAGLREGLLKGDVLVTSYDIVARDIDALSPIRFSTVVFDEAQSLKNPEAMRSRAAAQLNAGFRLGLTGTPLENHLGEIHSLFSLLTPGLLGPRVHFRSRFAVPIERDQDEAKQARLREILRPFLLRRTKAQVLTELPPRVEVIRSVDLSDDERALYEAERRHALTELSSNDPNKARFAVLAALMRLRRLACHPRLVHPDTTVPSSKLESALELFEDLRHDGHRALVFSQFTSHLALVRQALRVRGVEPLYLDGQTPATARASLVRTFQEGDAPLFLISLKAGGLGLNLTAADTVVHLDPWWNPATEDQASDRTHRIGQLRTVTVIRLVSQGTIEEAVVDLHAQKRALSQAILDGAETNASLSTDDLLGLLNISA